MDDMEAVFQALAHRDRRHILDIVKNRPGCCVGDVCAHFKVSRIAVMKQLGVLEAANLIVSEKKGRQRRLYHNTAPIQMIYDRWTTEYSQFWAGKVLDVKYAIEGRPPAEAPSSKGTKSKARKPKQAGKHDRAGNQGPGNG